MKRENKKVIWVNPVERISYQGRHKQVYVMGQPGGAPVPTVSMRRTKATDEVAEIFNFLENPQSGKLDTGFDVLVTNPVFKADAREAMSFYNLPSSWSDILESIVDKRTISKQMYYEINHGVDPDYYSSVVEHSMIKMPANINDFGSKKTFLQRLNLILYPRPNQFSTETPRQELLMEMIYKLPYIANNKTEINSAIHTWYISQENEEEMEALKRQEVIESAIYRLYKLKHESTPHRAYQVGVVLRNKDSRPVIKGAASTEAVHKKLSDYITSKDRYQLENISRFIDIMDSLEDREGTKRFEIQYLVQQAINTNIIAVRDKTYVWLSKAGTPNVYELSTNFDEVVSFFLKEYKEYSSKSELQNWYKELLEEVKAKGVPIENLK